MKQCLKIEIGLPYVNFKTIGKFEKITEDYRKAVNAKVASIVIHPAFYHYKSQQIDGKRMVTIPPFSQLPSSSFPE